MKLNPESLEVQLLHLPSAERARLAELLLASLDAADSDVLSATKQGEVDSAWATEADRRYAELARGAVAGIPAADVYAELEAELRAGRTGGKRLPLGGHVSSGGAPNSVARHGGTNRSAQPWGSRFSSRCARRRPSLPSTPMRFHLLRSQVNYGMTERRTLGIS